jgi:putative toxin-antitoxin system antitoxin component (TIGR02293 family)
MASAKERPPVKSDTEEAFGQALNERWLGEHEKVIEDIHIKADRLMPPLPLPKPPKKTSLGRTQTEEMASTPFSRIERVRAGLPYKALESLQEAAGLNQVEVAAVVGITERTFTRRKQEGRLTPTESDRVDRIARLLELATKVLEDEENARTWVHRPNRGLGGKTPLELLDTDLGVRVVENVLMRIEYGTYG